MCRVGGVRYPWGMAYTRSNIIKGRIAIGVLVVIPATLLGVHLYLADSFERVVTLGILALIVAFWCGVYYVETTK